MFIPLTIDINIVNGNLFLSDGFREGGISIEGNKIIKIGKEPSLEKASLTIDAQGAIILPGLIDIHVHFRDFEQKYKETLESGTRSALAGGVTSVLDMPNNKPPTNSLKRIKNKIENIEGKSAVNIGFYSLLPEDISEIDRLVENGIFAFKIYPAENLYPPKDDQTLSLFLKSLAEHNIPLIIHPDNGYASDNEIKLFETNMDRVDAFLKAHNQIDEANALSYFIQLSKKFSNELHCAHVTAKETVEILRKNENLKKLSSEVCPHHLTLTEIELRKLGSEAKCLPPLRNSSDQKSLWEALNDDIINIISTDHAPHSYEEKHCEFEHAASGVHGLETLLPIMFTKAQKGYISFESLIRKMTENPAKLMKITNRGQIKENFFADITIIKKEKYKVNAEEFESKAKWTPFEGTEVNYKPWKVLVNGLLVKDDEFISSKAHSGSILKRK